MRQKVNVLTKRSFKRIDQHVSIRKRLFSNLIPKNSLFQEARLISIYKRNFLNAKEDQRLLHFILVVKKFAPQTESTSHH